LPPWWAGGDSRLDSGGVQVADAELFTPDRYRDGFTPWRGRTASQVAGLRSGGENKTPPVDQQPLLAAAFYLTGTLGLHVLALASAAGAKRFDPHALAEARPAIAAVLGKVGTAKPWGRDAADVTSADGAVGLPWTLPLDTLDLQDMIGLLRTSAC